MTTTEPAPPHVDPQLYPQRDETHYDRATWMMGEDGLWGVVVEGHDRRSWAALNAHARLLDSEVAIDLHATVQGPDPMPRPSWMTWVDDCGCTALEHDAHAATITPEQAHIGTTCWDLTDRRICNVLPPCVRDGDVGWVPEFTPGPRDGAVPVLVWQFDQ